MLDKNTLRPPRLNYPPLSFMNCRERGWVNLGDTRMVFFDVRQGFYQLRRLIEKEVGKNSNHVVFQAGIRGGYSFLVPMLLKGHISPDSAGFLEGLTHNSDAGFGDFKVMDFKWEEDWVIIQFKNATEGWAFVENREIQEKTVCDYTRGVFLAFMKGTHRHARTGLDERLHCIETSCIGRAKRVLTFFWRGDICKNQSQEWFR